MNARALPLARAHAAPRADVARPRLALALVAALMALGLVIVAVADAYARTGAENAGAMFWIGLAVLVVPVADAVAGPATATQRLALVLGLGVALYLVKVMQEPFAFTYADELVHAHNADTTASTGALFGSNSILPITPRFPGLPALTAAVEQLAGVDAFAAGVAVVALARVLLVAALFALYSAIGGSSRLAGLGCLVYMGNPNFLFFTGQFAYESLALPLAVAVVLAAHRADAGHGRAWLATAVVVIAAVTVTHHLTSYAVVAVLTLAALAARRRHLGALAALAALFAAGWMLLVAPGTTGYLGPVISKAVDSGIAVITSSGEARAPFGGGGSTVTPALGDRAIGVLAVALLAAALPFGMRALWRRRSVSPFVLPLIVCAVAYFAALGLRLVPDAWELGNRTSEFLFVGLALVAARGWLELSGRWSRIGLAVAVWVVFAGGVIAGWPADLRLADVYRVAEHGTTIEAPGPTVARWSAGALGPGARFAADASNARLLQAYAGQWAIAGTYPAVESVLRADRLDPWHLDLLRHRRLRYLLYDRRRASDSPMEGARFPHPGEAVRRRQTRAKLESFAGADRVLDAGSIRIYDFGPGARRARP